MRASRVAAAWAECFCLLIGGRVEKRDVELGKAVVKRHSYEGGDGWKAEA